MASFSRRPSRLWTIDECALFAARKEFELLKLLSTDKKAMAGARRLGLNPSTYTRRQADDGFRRLRGARRPRLENDFRR